VSRPLTILIDTGFTGTILISDRLAHRLHYHTIPSHCPIKLAEGTTITAAQMVPDLSWTLHNTHSEVHNAALFPLQSYDVVLGMQWLRDHEAYIDCASLTLKFYHNNQWLESKVCNT